VRTSRGSFIAVEDLRNLVKDTADLKKDQIKEMPRHRSFAAAREAALRDEEFRKLFDKPAPPSTDITRKDLVKERTSQTADSA